MSNEMHLLLGVLIGGAIVWLYLTHGYPNPFCGPVVIEHHEWYGPEPR